MKLSATTPPQDGANARLDCIARARQAMLHEQDASAAWVAPWIARSWQRCLRLGFEPERPVTFELVPEPHRRRTLEANHALVQTALPLMEQLGRAIVNTRYFAILTNAEGLVVAASGAIDHSDPRAHLITRIGTNLSEHSVGTTAIGSALSERQPVSLHRGEHFFQGTSVYSCAGAPLFGPDGDCVGMLDVTGIEAVERPELKHLVTQTVAKIEDALVLQRSHQLMLRLNWPGSTLGSAQDGLLCMDADGWITGANANARLLAPALACKPAQPIHISEVIAMPFELLFDAARHRASVVDMPLWSGLRLQAIATAKTQATLGLASGLPNATLGASPHSVPLKDMELAMVRRAIQQAQGNVSRAAQALGISRATLYRKLGRQAPKPSDAR